MSTPTVSNQGSDLPPPYVDDDDKPFPTFHRYCRSYASLTKTWQEDPTEHTDNDNQDLSEVKAMCEGALDGLDSSFQRLNPIDLPARIIGSQDFAFEGEVTLRKLVSQLPPQANWTLLHCKLKEITALQRNSGNRSDVAELLETAGIYSMHCDWAWKSVPLTLGIAHILSQGKYAEKLKVTPDPHVLQEIVTSSSGVRFPNRRRDFRAYVDHRDLTMRMTRQPPLWRWLSVACPNDERVEEAVTPEWP